MRHWYHTGMSIGDTALWHRRPGVSKELIAEVKAMLLREGYSHREAIGRLRGAVIAELAERNSS